MIKQLLTSFFIFFISIVIGQQTYYNDVNLTLSGTSLKNALKTKITTTHTNKLFYSPAVWEASKITDINPNNTTQVTLIYGWENGADADITNDKFREKSLQDTGNGSSFVWNREHVFPKSLASPKFVTDIPGPGTDAHNLRPADRTRNSTRSNQKFADGSGNSGNVAGGWYPGDEWKGDVARMMMYMYVRYESQCLPTAVGVGSSAATSDDMIDLFLKWNAEDPVSDLEIKRNTYHEDTANNTNAQGNRNPFIDNPHLATRIWGGPTAHDKWGIYITSDNEAPTVPTNVTLSNITTSKITVSWTASTDNVSVTGYDIYVNDIYQDNITGTTTTLEDLLPNNSFSIKLLAKDFANNKSSFTTPVVGKTLVDNTPPSVPTNLVVSNETDTSFKIAWDASTDDSFVGTYHIYLNGNFFFKTSKLNYTVTGLTKSTNYNVTVLASDIAGNESAQSSIIVATTTDGSSSGANELFISEYVEGSGNNKAIEIANPTNTNIDLAGYSIKRQTNGSGEWQNKLSLSGTITNGDVYVIINSDADDATLIAQADLVVQNVTPNWGAPINFNGNDPVGLFKNDVLIDIVGVYNGGSADFAKDKTLRRKESVSKPNILFNETNEWLSFPQNTVANIGILNTTLSVRDFDYTGFAMYPNPLIGNTLYLSQVKNQKITKLIVFNSNGQRILTLKNPGNSVNLEKLSSGLYIIKLESNEKIGYKKLLKN